MKNNWKRKKENLHSYDLSGEGNIVEREKDGLTWLSFPALEQDGLAVNGFSTRSGGVSEGKFATMNLSFTRGDDPEHVLENYRHMAGALDVDINGMVLSYQTHTTNIRKVTEEDRGKGIFKERDYRDVDGLITNIPGITLVTFYADCVPLYLLDPVHKAVGLSHSGWRGTVGRMGQKTVEAMQDAYASRPTDLIACIGPSICGECYEVGAEVAEEFQKVFDKGQLERILTARQDGKYLLNLWTANQLIFEAAGLHSKNIHTTDICTRCNADALFSHRAHGEERGNLAAFLSLR